MQVRKKINLETYYEATCEFCRFLFCFVFSSSLSTFKKINTITNLHIAIIFYLNIVIKLQILCNLSDNVVYEEELNLEELCKLDAHNILEVRVFPTNCIIIDTGDCICTSSRTMQRLSLTANENLLRILKEDDDNKTIILPIEESEKLKSNVELSFQKMGKHNHKTKRNGKFSQLHLV